MRSDELSAGRCGPHGTLYHHRRGLCSEYQGDRWAL